jgi:hypothetical protein
MSATPTLVKRRAGARRRITILDALRDEALFGRAFPEAPWRVWRTFLAALFGLPMTTASLAVYQGATGRQQPPEQAAREAWMVAGRRGGKSRIAALVAVFLACFRDYRAVLAPGEHGTVMVIAADRRQARIVFRYIEGLIDGVPMLRALVVRRTRETITLNNRIVIEVHTASFRAVRGYTVVAAICDEIAFWRSEESANPDTEILTALRPAMATVPGALLLCISSPYARRGALWQAYRDHFGREGDPVLVWQADTRTMNPSVEARVIADAYARDDAAAAAEYGAQFRRDIESYVSREALDAATPPGRRELAPLADLGYLAFVDPSGGSQDAMTLAIAHAEGARAVLDLVRERRPPFSPDAVVAEFAETLHAYGIAAVVGDRYAGEWPREAFRQAGIEYLVADQPKSDLYRALLPALNSERIDLLDHPRLVTELGALERRTARGGRDSIDHAPGGHDDLANAAAGALVLALNAGVVSDCAPSVEELEMLRNVFAPASGLFVGIPRDEIGEYAL